MWPKKNPTTTTSQASHGIEWVGSANESLADLRDGGREANHNWRREKKELPKSDGIPVPGKSPVADGASGDVPVELCSPCTSATNREQHPWEHLTESWKSHPNLGDGVLAMADVQRQLGIWGTLGNGGGWSQPLLGASRRALITS